MTTSKLSETEFIESCAKLYMHLYNWELSGYTNYDKSKWALTPPCAEKTRAKLDKDFAPNKSYEPYTKFFTQEQLDATGVSWIPYACYLVDESSFTRVVAAGSWSADPLHECGELDIQRIRQDFSDPIAQFILGYKISITNPTYKVPYDTVNCEFEKFITSLDLAIQIYDLMTQLDKYSQALKYAELYGQEFMDQLESKLEFDIYDNVRAAREKERAKEDARREEERAKKEAERKAAGILTWSEIQTETAKIAGELQKLANEVSKIKIDHVNSELQVYKAALENGQSKEDIKNKITELKESLNKKFLELKTNTDLLNDKYTKLCSMQATSTSELTSCLTKLTQSLKELTDISNSMEELYETA